MKTTHTPGPWNVVANDVFSLDNDALICECFSGIRSKPLLSQAVTSAQADANARLIAAAPELLAALEAISEGDVMSKKYGPAHMFGHAEVVHEYQAIARAAIAKAKGQA